MVINNKIAKKILLINPPSEFKTPVLPLGLAYIAAYLLKNDIDISVIDAWAEKIDFPKLKEKILQSKAGIIGIYMVSPRYDEAKKTIEVCREALPDSLIIAGGPHPSAVPIETLKEIPQLDICAIGEGEITMFELVRCFQNNYNLSAVDGIAFREKNTGKIIATKPREFIKNLDILPFPARELFPIEKYKTHPPYGRKNPYLSMITSRGCPYRCAYCSKDVFGQIYHALSPKCVCDEIEELIKKYNAREIHFYDDDFTMDMKRAEEICDEIIRRNIKISWSCTTRVNLVDENLLKKMKTAGCWLIAYGAESGNQKILDTINKGITIKQIETAFELTRKIGISTLAYLMVGLPGETIKTIEESIELAKKIKPNFVSWGILIVYPGSSFFKSVQDGTYKGELKTLNREKDNLAGTFFGKGNYVVFEDNLTFEELRKAVKKANKSFYLRPAYIFQALKNIRSVSNLIYYLNGGIEVLKSIIK
jgi:radical SAM superfamily enzyme YgiQ (UPF0313 family)